VLAALSRSPHGPVDPARLSHHAEAAGDASAVLEYAPVAAERAAMLGAHVQATEQYERALRYAAILAPERQAELYERLAFELHLGDGDLDRPLAAAETALALRRELGQRREEGVTLAFIARVQWFLGNTPEAEAAAHEAVRILEAVPPSPELAMAYADTARLAGLAHRLDDARSWALKAIGLAEEVGTGEILSSAFNTLGTIQLRDGGEEGWTSLERSLELAEASDNDDHVARALVNFAGMALELRLYERADEFINRAMEYISERDLGRSRGFLLASRARWNLEQGDWDAALASAELALRPHRPIPLVRVAALVIVGLVHARRGQEGATTALDEALRLTVHEELQQLGPAAAARAEAAWLDHDLTSIGPSTEEAFALACERRSAQFAGELAYWRFKGGITEDFPEWAAEPYVMQIRGDWEGAADRWSQLGCRYEAALALSESGEVEATRLALE
jgi:hypothetical protein